MTEKSQERIAVERMLSARTSIPRCRECRWCEPMNIHRSELDKCMYPPFWQGMNIMAGWVVLAMGARQNDKFCGVNGKHFERKPDGAIVRFLKTVLFIR